MNNKVTVLDLFCGGGGSAIGLLQYFDEIVGVDINPHPEYPSQFIQHDIFAGSFLSNECLKWMRSFGFIWASPPCQRYSRVTPEKEKHPDLIAKTQLLLNKVGRPYVIENVPSAPIRRDLFLCGEMFNLKVIRHRIFEISGFTVKQPEHLKHRGSPGTQRWPYKPINGYVQVTGNNFKIIEAQLAMGILHIKDKKTLAEAIPPKYAEYIAKAFFEANR